MPSFGAVETMAALTGLCLSSRFPEPAHCSASEYPTSSTCKRVIFSLPQTEGVARGWPGLERWRPGRLSFQFRLPLSRPFRTLRCLLRSHVARLFPARAPLPPPPRLRTRPGSPGGGGGRSPYSGGEGRRGTALGALRRCDNCTSGDKPGVTNRRLPETSHRWSARRPWCCVGIAL